MKFVYDTGIRRKLFHNVRLWGSWDSSGRYSDEWTEVPMKERLCGDGGIVFESEVSLHASEVGKSRRQQRRRDQQFRRQITVKMPARGFIVLRHLPHG